MPPAYANPKSRRRDGCHNTEFGPICARKALITWVRCRISGSRV